MKMNFDKTSLLGLAGGILTVAAALLSNVASDKKMEKTISEEVSKQLNSK